MQKKLSWIIIICLIPFISLAATFQAGTDYQVIKNSSANTTTKTVHVIEFFNPACPWCYHLEPHLDKWLQSKPKDVDFKRIPVAFNSSWQVLAKAYYAAEALGVADKVLPAMFDAIHKQNMDISNVDALQKIFAEQGVSKADFESAFSFSPGIDAELSRANQLMKEYSVMSVPTIVIDGKYKTDTGLTGGDTNKMMQVVEYLVKKVEK